MIRRLKGSPGPLGGLDATLSEGLVAVVAPNAHSLGLFQRAVAGGLLETGEPDGLTVEVDDDVPPRDRAPAAVLRTGPGMGFGPDDVLRAAADALAKLRGASHLEGAAERLGVVSDGVGGGGGSDAGPTSGAGGDRVAHLEAELQELRADHAEVVGDLEVATMAWLRERQDAETHLQAYRDRARELQVRLKQLQDAGPEAPCPTCGRVLQSHFEAVVQELKEEWESVVQDGKWWKRRREQLELKPVTLQELEGRSLRLQAATESCAERLERARVGVDAADGAVAEVGEGEKVGEPAPEATVSRAMANVRTRMRQEAADRIVALASRVLTRVTGSDLLGLTVKGDGRLRLEGAGGPVDAPTEEERSVVMVALRVAAALAWAEDGRVSDSLLLDDVFDRMDDQVQLRTVEVLRSLLPRLGQVLLVTRGDVVERSPESFDDVFELRTAHRSLQPEAGSSLRPLPAGVARVRIL